MRNLLLLSVALLTLTSCNKDLIEDQREQITDLKYQVRVLGRTIFGLNQQLEDSQSVIEAKTLEISELTSIINELSDSNEEMASVIAGLQDRVGVLLNDILNLTSVNEDLVEEIDTLANMNDTLELNVSSLEGELAYANSLLDDANLLIASLEAENAQLTDDLANAIAAGVELKNKIARKNQKISRLKDKLSDSNADIQDLESQISLLEAELVNQVDLFNKQSRTIGAMLSFACNGGQRVWLCNKLVDIVNKIWQS